LTLILRKDKLRSEGAVNLLLRSLAKSMNSDPHGIFPDFTGNPPPFVGREEEMASLEQGLVYKDRRVVCITGMAGIGKSALAQTFGRRFVEIHGGNLVSLAGTRELFTLDILDDRMRNTNTPTLVILNDADQLTRNALERLLTQFLPGFPHCRLILTSRKVISDPRIDWVLHLDTFTEAESEQLLRLLLGDSLRLNAFKSDRLYQTFRGHPRALNILAGALKNGVLTAKEIWKYLEPFVQEGMRSVDGKPLAENSKSYKTIISNITDVSDEFLKKLVDNPSLLYEISPRSFEELVAELLRRQGYEVELTPASRDGGKDIYIASKDSLGSFLYLVECKRFAPDRPVGVGLIRQLYGTVQAERATAGIFATTSFFTKDAQEFQSKVEFQISLQDYLGIQRWIHVALR